MNKDFERRKALYEAAHSEKDVKGAVDNTTIVSMISDLIKDEWEAIDGYNSAVVAMMNMGVPQKVIDIMNDISSEEYIHVGQLEKALQSLIPMADEKMEEGENEAEETLGEQSSEEEFDDSNFPLSDEDVAKVGDQFFPPDDVREDE